MSNWSNPEKSQRQPITPKRKVCCHWVGRVTAAVQYLRSVCPRRQNWRLVPSSTASIPQSQCRFNKFWLMELSNVIIRRIKPGTEPITNKIVHRLHEHEVLYTSAYNAPSRETLDTTWNFLGSFPWAFLSGRKKKTFSTIIWGGPGA